jgi:hypothetical protein
VLEYWIVIFGGRISILSKIERRETTLRHSIFEILRFPFKIHYVASGAPERIAAKSSYEKSILIFLWLIKLAAPRPEAGLTPETPGPDLIYHEFRE